MREGNATSNKPSFFQTLPGILTAFATLITAMVGGYVAIFKEDTTKETILLKSPDTLVASTTTQPIANDNTQQPIAKLVEIVNLSGIWKNSSGYLNIKQEGNSLSFDDWNYYGTKVGEGTGIIDGINVNLMGMTTDPVSGSVIHYTAKLQTSNNGHKLFGTIKVPQFETQFDIYFEKD